MARIRSIKPEFWSSEQVMECSPNARLLFIGMWNFCDDAGRHPASPKQLKALIFPGDNFSPEDIGALVVELAEVELIKLYDVDSKTFFHVTGWSHQKIDKPQEPKYPEPIKYRSPNDRRPLVVGEDRRGKEEICPKPAEPVRTRNQYPDDFLDFWSSYPTDKLMSKSEAGKVWAKLSEAHRALAISSIPGFKSYCAKNPTYRTVHAVRYLSQRRFEGFAPDGRPPEAGKPSDPRIDFGGGYTSPLSSVLKLHQQGRWLPEWGPPIGQHGCKVPQQFWPRSEVAA